MQATKKTNSQITLILNEHDAGWLKAAMQNPLCERESADNKLMRQKLFNALNLPKEES